MTTTENPGPGREIKKGTLNVMWGGVWVPLGDAEFIAEGGRVVKVISFTPREFHADEEKESPAPEQDGFLEEQRTGEDG